jgi:hypothetical protein
MTRFLSEALGAVEPVFSRSIQQLEHAAGRPATDIRLTAHIVQNTRAKIAQLGLDPDDTTGPELYGALQLRLKEDELTARKTLGLKEDALPDEVVAGVTQFLNKHESARNCFVLKSSVAKRLLKKKSPKAAMKRLGYRSADSMLKHESAAEIYAAALIAESNAWHRAFREQYTRLTPSDFEPKKISLLHPDTKRWQMLAHDYVAKSRHNLLSFPELGSVVLLPINQAVNGLAVTTLLLAAEEMNRIRAHSSYIKLQQVKPDFGKLVQKSSVSEPYTSARLAGQPVPWRMVQRYYSRFSQAYHPEIFEPHVQSDDLNWSNGEDVLAKLDPSLAFWQGTSYLGLIHDGAIVSCNALDVALGCCNELSFQDRIVHFVRDNLWHELMMRYLNQENLEAAVHRQLAGELVEEN